jgi:hypothetical protein
MKAEAKGNQRGTLTTISPSHPDWEKYKKLGAAKVQPLDPLSELTYDETCKKIALLYDRIGEFSNVLDPKD